MKPKLYTSATVPVGQGGADGDTALGTNVGNTLGLNVGTAVSATVGDALGLNVGAAVSATVGDTLGLNVGNAVSATVADALGLNVGSDDFDGANDGAYVGFGAGSHPDRAAFLT